jgi:Putative adhesin
MRPTPLVVLALTSIFAPPSARAQYEDRARNWEQNCRYRGNYDRAHFCELRNITLRPSDKISVDGHENGGVAFYGWDRNEVKVVAMIQTNADDDRQAEELAKQIRINTDGGQISAEGPSSRSRRWWSVSYEIYVPKRSNLEAVTRNGGVSAVDVEGDLDLHATNGGIHVDNVGGDVRGETTNGGVHASLSGNSWRGKGLDLRTTNGGVDLTIPRGYNARLETGTTNGGMRVDFPITVQGMIGKRIETQLGSGGPLVRVVTTNGGVRISER